MAKEKFQKVSFIENAGKIAVALASGIGLAAAVWGISGRQSAPPQVIIVPNPAVSPTPSIPQLVPLVASPSPETRRPPLLTAPAPFVGNPDIQVWVNTETGIYHCPGTKWFKEKTKHGHYMTQKEAQERNYQPARRNLCK
jgi:hypothetical protein